MTYNNYTPFNEVCDEIRNDQVCVEVKAATAWSRRLGHIYPDGICYRVTKNTKTRTGWWDLDDLGRAVVHREGVLVHGYGWYVIPARYAPHLISAFDIIGALDRLEFMAVTG
jgi:hypothetical protein